MKSETKMNRVQNFLKQYQSPNTRRVYHWALAEFFSSVYGYEVEKGNSDKELIESCEKYFTENFRYDEEKKTWAFINTEKIEQDIKNLLEKIGKVPPKTKRLLVSAIRSFFRENHVELEDYFWKHLARTIKGNRAVTQDKVPSTVQLRRIITHMPIQGKALFLTLASSGMRIGESLQLEIDDVDLAQNPVQINIRAAYTKNGNPRITFVSKEAREALEEWLKNREAYLVTASAKCQYRPNYKMKKEDFKGKNVNDSRIFPFDESTAYAIWKNALNKAGFNEKDKTTKRDKIHPHTLRKFFRTKMAQLIEVDVVEVLMGHEGYLTNEYRHYEAEDLAKFYTQGEAAVLIFTEAEEVQKLKIEVDESRRNLQQLIAGQQTEIYELKNKVANKDEEINKMFEDWKMIREKIDPLLDVIEDPKVEKAVQKARLAKLERETREAD